MFYLYGEKNSKKYCKTKIKKKIHGLKSKWYIGEIKFTVLIFFPEELVIILLIGLQNIQTRNFTYKKGDKLPDYSTFLYH